MAADTTAVCGDQLFDWTCTREPGMHPDRKHRGSDGTWWTQTEQVPDSTATELAIAAMRAERKALGYPATGNEWLLLAAYDQLEGANRELATELAIVRKQLKELDEVIESLGIPGRAVTA